MFMGKKHDFHGNHGGSTSEDVCLSLYLHISRHIIAFLRLVI